MPGRCIRVSIFCIQFSPTIRFWSLTNGSRPQKVTNTRQRTPLAAAVDDRMRTGQTLSRSPDQLTMTSSLILAAPSVSGAMPAPGSGTGALPAGGSMVRVIADASLSAQDEAVDAFVG